jgi:hypothetical protein
VNYLIISHPPLAIRARVAMFFYGILPLKGAAGASLHRGPSEEIKV